MLFSTSIVARRMEHLKCGCSCSWPWGQKIVIGKPKMPGKVVGKDLLPKGRRENYKQKVGRDFIQTEFNKCTFSSD